MIKKKKPVKKKNLHTNDKKLLFFVSIIAILLVIPLTIISLNSNTNSRSNAQIANPNPVGQTGDWNMIFSDEFTGTSVDLTKWRPNWLAGNDTTITNPVNSSEASCYDPKQATVANGELDLTAIQSQCAVGSKTYNYRSGMLESDGKFNFTYGYFEARMWTPATTGAWPAFWSDGQNWPTDGEIDVLEAYGTDNSTYHYHYAGCGGDCNPGGNVSLTGATAGWHTYAADWEPGNITWYYDGQPVWQYTTGIVSSPQFLILNLGLNSATASTPSTLKVDYVRVWQKATNSATPTGVFTPTLTPVVTSTPPLTPKPTNAPTPTIISPATVTVTSLNESGTKKNIKATVTYTLQTTGSLTVSNLLVAVRDQRNRNFDFPGTGNRTLAGMQQFSASRSFGSGTYTYWVAYYRNGVWVNLSPKKSFTIK